MERSKGYAGNDPAIVLHGVGFYTKMKIRTKIKKSPPLLLPMVKTTNIKAHNDNWMGCNVYYKDKSQDGVGMNNPNPKPFGAKKSIAPIKFWDMERDGVTQSLLSLFALCPQRAYWKMVEGLQGGKPHKALQFGTYFHDVLDKAYSMSRRPTTNQRALSDIKFWEVLSGKVLGSTYEEAVEGLDDIKDQQAFELIYGLCDVVLARYFRRWGRVDRKAKIIAVEMVFEFPYRLRDGTVIMIRGKIDRIDEIDGELWVYDHKTKSQIEGNYIVEKMGFDMQMMVYCMAVFHKYGKWPKGVVYNLIKRPGQIYSGTYYKKTESIPQYLQRVDAHMQEKGDEYFCRYTISLLPREIELFRDRDLDYVIERLYEWQNGGIASFRNSGACSNWNRACEFLPLCSNDRDARSKYTVRDSVFPELTEVEE
jgi:hypothetical protein